MPVVSVSGKSTVGESECRSKVAEFSHDCCEDVENNYAANFPKAMDPVALSQTTGIPVPKTRESFNLPKAGKKAQHPVFLKQT